MFMNLNRSLESFERRNANKVILSDVDIIDRDIGGEHGTDSETANRKIIFTGDYWSLEYDHYKTIQPSFGQTIRSEIDSSNRKLSQEDLTSFLHGEDVTVRELKIFFTNLDK